MEVSPGNCNSHEAVRGKAEVAIICSSAPLGPTLEICAHVEIIQCPHNKIGEGNLVTQI